MPDLLAFLLPKRCIFCRNPCEDGICADCQDKLPWRAPERADAKPSGDGQAIPDVRAGAPPVIAPLYYRDMVRFALHRYKFRGFSGYAEVFGTLMAQAVCDLRVEADAVTWVPCSFLRRWTRGYDQSEKLARAAAKRLGLPAIKLLVKTRRAKSQTKMTSDGARRENVRGAFKALPPARGKRVLLIDDIYTSGATMEECRAALQAAGAANVFFCAAASRR